MQSGYIQSLVNTVPAAGSGAHAAKQGSGFPQYRFGPGATLLPASFNPVAKLVRQRVGQQAGPPGVESPDLADPHIRGVLDEFAAERLATHTLAQIKARTGDATPAWYRAVYQALAGEEQVAVTALEPLARYRRQSIITALVELGIERKRLIPALAAHSTADGEDVTVRLALEPLLSRDLQNGSAAGARLLPASLSSAVKPRRRESYKRRPRRE